MKSLFTGVIAAAALVGNPAHAEMQVEAQLFSAAYAFVSYSPQMSLLSDDGLTVRLALTGVAADEASGGSIDWRSPGGGSPTPDNVDQMYYSSNDNYLSFNIKDGYRVQSFTLTGTVTGSMWVTDVPSGTPQVDIGSHGYTSAWSQWGLDSTSSGRTYDLRGTRTFSLEHESGGTGEIMLHVSHEVKLNMGNAYRWVYDDGMRYVEYFPSGIALDFSDIVLTVQLAPVAAVPEPTTWAMLLGGLVLVGGVARRRRP